TVMKSVPKNTPLTPSISNRRSASGDCAASAALGMSSVPSASTARPGRNFSVAGFGVASVWMNIIGLPGRRGSKGPRGRSPCTNWGFVRKGQCGRPPRDWGVGANEMGAVLTNRGGWVPLPPRAERVAGRGGGGGGGVCEREGGEPPGRRGGPPPPPPPPAGAGGGPRVGRVRVVE